mmetsp:Transcript_46924/g.116985  ORF Transcript_46924/g.116985 Transcript_46924/m.116985 type:complete len:84 (-) Transcript_46924:19-270(-)
MLTRIVYTTHTERRRWLDKCTIPPSTPTHTENEGERGAKKRQPSSHSLISPSAVQMMSVSLSVSAPCVCAALPSIDPSMGRWA